MGLFLSMKPPIQTLYYGGEEANTYVLGYEGEPAIVFDFGKNDNHRVESYCAKHHPFIAGIFITHGHVDHIQGLAELQVTEGLRVVLHGLDAECLTSPRLNASSGLFGKPFSLEKELPMYWCEDEDEILLGARHYEGPDGKSVNIGGHLIRVIHTPFHTAGSCCFYLPEEGVLFSGDTLFHLGIGRMDLPGAKPRLLEDSLRKLLSLPDKTKVYPGHGPSTSIGEEKRYNPYLLGLK